MKHSMKVGAAMVVAVGLVMSSVAGAHAVTDPGDGEVGAAEQAIVEALAPLLEDGTLAPDQARAVIDELAPLSARALFRDRTRVLVKRLGRLGAETAEVLGITPDDLAEQLEAGATVAEIAAANGSSGDQLVDAVTDHIAAHLAVQVTAGKLEEAQAGAIVVRSAETLRRLVDVENPLGTLVKARRNRAARTDAFAAVADALGMAIDDVRLDLESGMSLAQIAGTRGVGEQVLIDVLLGPVIARIDRAVDRGRLTDEAAAGALGRATHRAKEVIARVPGT
jgi:hypothetical protein